MSPNSGEKEGTCSGHVVVADVFFFRGTFLSLLSPHLFHPFDVLNPLVNGQGQAGITTMDYYTLSTGEKRKGCVDSSAYSVIHTPTRISLSLNVMLLIFGCSSRLQPSLSFSTNTTLSLNCHGTHAHNFTVHSPVGQSPDQAHTLCLFSFLLTWLTSKKAANIAKKHVSFLPHAKIGDVHIFIYFFKSETEGKSSEMSYLQYMRSL